MNDVQGSGDESFWGRSPAAHGTLAVERELMMNGRVDVSAVSKVLLLISYKALNANPG